MPSARELKKRAQKKRSRKRSVDSRRNNLEKQRYRDHAKNRGKQLEGIHAVAAAALKGTDTSPPSIKSKMPEAARFESPLGKVSP